MIYLIAAVCKTKDGRPGLSKNGKIPWNLPSDNNYFKTLVSAADNIVIGKNTYEEIKNLNCLKNKKIYVLSHKKEKNHYCEDDIINKIIYSRKKENTYIIGGSCVYNLIDLCDKLYITEIDKTFSCDTYFPQIPSYYKIKNYSGVIKENDISYRFLTYKNKIVEDQNEQKYLDLGKELLHTGQPRIDRTGVGTIGFFGHQMKFDISKSVPLLTTKKVPWKMCVEELLWFLRGETDAKILQEKNIHIWDGNTSREFLDNMGFTDVPTGELRYGYGHQIRRFGPNKVDQLLYVENLLKTDPFSRRIMWNLWNASDLKEMVLTPCHNQVQFYVKQTNGVKKLSAQLYCRSSDYFLGLPFNIFSYTVLVYILAKRCNMEPDRLIVVLGDSHIYKNHIEQTKQLLQRTPVSPPCLYISDTVKSKNYNDISINDFDVVGYFPEKNIYAKMAI